MIPAAAITISWPMSPQRFVLGFEPSNFGGCAAVVFLARGGFAAVVTSMPVAGSAAPAWVGAGAGATESDALSDAAVMLDVAIQTQRQPDWLKVANLAAEGFLRTEMGCRPVGPATENGVCVAARRAIIEALTHAGAHYDGSVDVARRGGELLVTVDRRLGQGPVE